MQRLDTEEVYVLANRRFPDDSDLAAFNLIYEIRNGLLIPVDPEALPKGEAKLVGMVGYLDLGGDEFWIMQTLGQHVEVEGLLEMMEARILELPDVPDEERERLPTIEREFPTAIGALGAWRTPDGATHLAVYRHPDVSAHRAYAILKVVIAEAEAQRAGAGAIVSGGN